MLPLVLAVFSLVAVADPPTITPAEASKHVGELVVVKGTVDQVSVSLSETTYLNFGGRYPNHTLTAVISKAKRAQFPNVKSYEGKVAQVRGVVQLYRGEPEITLNEPGQLRSTDSSLSVNGSVENPPSERPAPATRGDVESRSLAGLYFDPQGADFTIWIQHFKDEVYFNWIVPQTALSGAERGHVDFEFTVERDGSVSSVRMLKSSGTELLDRAGENALTKSHFGVLPEAYSPPRVTMQLTFYYR